MRLIRARYESGALVPLEPVRLQEGAELLVGIDDLPEAGSWRDHVSFHCKQVEPLCATFSWFLPKPGVGVPRVKECHLMLDQPGATRVVAVVSPAPGAPQVEQSVPLPPRAEAGHLEFGLRFLDREGGEHLVDEIAIRVPAVQVVLEDQVGGPPAAWSREGTWGRLESGIWTDSPVGDYPNSSDFSLTSPLISLGGLERTVLVFEERHSIEEFSDWCYLEVQCEDGPWERLEAYTGSSGWAPRRFDLSTHDGTRIRIRFRLVSDRSVTRDGFFFRNLMMAAAIPG